MTYRWVEHTGELELEIEAPTKPAVFLEALEAFSELVGGDGGVDAEPLRMEVLGDDQASLLVAWLDELVFLAETQGFVAERATELELDEGVLRAMLRGQVGDPPHLVKAVTLHRLEFEPDDEGWRARVVLDV